ncbi:MAG TPA: FHA domain-containing protein [Aggregatilineales bacterium]|nr:FHA domain-containing protein [Aggregatilineales bacterium]
MSSMTDYPSSMFQRLAKVTWDDPTNSERREFVLVVGATASIGRAPTNDIAIPERHVSRQHAVISFRDGIFVISDLGSANGTFVNDQRISEPYPLAHGDVIRLYVPILNFSAMVSEEDEDNARRTGTLIVPAGGQGTAKLMITSGAQEGSEIPLANETMTVGRTTQDAHWEISLQDRAVSRPHCRLTHTPDGWVLVDLGSANGTLLNNTPVLADPRSLNDGDVIQVGETTLLFRLPQ